MICVKKRKSLQKPEIAENKDIFSNSGERQNNYHIPKVQKKNGTNPN